MVKIQGEKLARKNLFVRARVDDSSVGGAVQGQDGDASGSGRRNISEQAPIQLRTQPNRNIARSVRLFAPLRSLHDWLLRQASLFTRQIAEHFNLVSRCNGKDGTAAGRRIEAAFFLCTAHQSRSVEEPLLAEDQVS